PHCPLGRDPRRRDLINVRRVRDPRVRLCVTPLDVCLELRAFHPPSSLAPDLNSTELAALDQCPHCGHGNLKNLGDISQRKEARLHTPIVSGDVPFGERLWKPPTGVKALE